MKELFHSQELVFKNPKSDIDFHWYNGSSYKHMHLDYYELIVVINGKFSHEYQGKTLKLSRGDAVLILPNHYHTQTSEQSNSLVANFSITIKTFNTLTQLLGNETYKHLRANSGKPFKLSEKEVEYLVYALNRTHSLADEGVSEAYYYTALLNLIFSIMNLEQKNDGNDYSTYPDWLKEFMSKINDPEVFCLPLSEIYGLSNYSRSRFTALFTSYVGTTPIKYIAVLKLNYAKQLLLKTNYNVLDICNLLNYSSLSHFITLFKKNTGYTPNEYRHKFYINVDDRIINSKTNAPDPETRPTKKVYKTKRKKAKKN
ncbi:MAG: AraC family transcriptional regulator [Clostridia bacterium]|nr:AraC family transcriptional regulator [Clostridia bacterium]